MYDKPDLTELLDAVRLHLEENIIPALRHDHKRYFQSLVAANVLQISLRELRLADAHAAAAWAGLNQLQGEAPPLPAKLSEQQAGLAARHQALCAAIRAGKYDDQDAKSALLRYLKASAAAQLEVANPRHLQKLLAEDANPDLDAWAGR